MPKRLEIYKAQCVNVRELASARKQVLRTINRAVKTNDKALLGVHTKLFGLLFCAWAEANFSKTIHTPHGFTPNEILQIKRAHADNGIVRGWNKCIELGLRKITARRGSFRPNAAKYLKRKVKLYIEDPSAVRNKIAHGQWSVALNRDNTNVNNDMTTAINSLNAVTIDGWFVCHKKLSEVVEALIESPQKTFIKDYWVILSELEQEMQRRQSWTLETKLQAMKPIRVPAPQV